MARIPINIRSVWNTEDFGDDESLGQHLVALCRQAVDQRGAPSSALCVRSDRVDVIPLQQLRKAKVSVPTFISGLTSAPLGDRGVDTDAVGLIGTFTYRRGKEGPGVQTAMVFLEWTDCRWWHWHALLDAESGDVIADTETVRCALDGDAKPSGLGGWWSFARRSNLRVRLDPVVH